MDMTALKWGMCRCYFEKNIFLKNLGHLTFINQDQFMEDYSQLLKGRNVAQIINTIQEEIQRRREIHSLKSVNRKIIKSKYTPLHKHLYDTSWPVLNVAQQQVQTEITGVYSFPFLTAETCNTILEELSNFKNSNIVHQKPTSMRKNGVLLDELGLDVQIEKLVRSVQPLARKYFPQLVGERGLDSFKAFTVEYDGEIDAAEADVEQATHFDNAEITLNIPLTKNYEGSELYFEYGTAFKSVDMKVGRALMHSGRHIHGVMPIEQGYRHNIIIWMRSSDVRNKICPMCRQLPALEEVLEGTGDGFTISDSQGATPLHHPDQQNQSYCSVT